MFRNRKSWVSSERSASCGFVCMMRRLSASGSAIVFCFPSGPVGVARCCWLGEGGGLRMLFGCWVCWMEALVGEVVKNKG